MSQRVGSDLMFTMCDKGRGIEKRWKIVLHNS